MGLNEFRTEDLSLIKKKGFEKDQISDQIEKIKNGIVYSDLNRPAKLNDGIKLLSKNEESIYYNLFERIKNDLKIIKFVPASGAASRMFLDLQEFYNKKDLKENDYIKKFMSGVKNKKFAFLKDLESCLHQNGHNLLTCVENNDIRLILKYLLTKEGLNYSNLPKAVLKFHIYENDISTPIEEQIIEGINYGIGMNNNIFLHFTISSECEEIILKNIKNALNKINHDKKKINISISSQKENTQTIALNSEKKLFRTLGGDIFFRPGGHGALIENLNELDGSIIFIKNIDNVSIRKYSEETTYYKKVLCGFLLNVRDRVFELTKSLIEKKYDENSIIEIQNYCKTTLNIFFTKNFYSSTLEKKVDDLIEILERPIRVCGMVKNEGEPGGGPFWVNKEGSLSLQIIEKASINDLDKTQVKIFEKADFFNPVDIVCSIKNYEGKKYDLKKFIDNKSFFVSEKSKDGETLNALELPGLWNGAMSDWISIFIEVPLITFNPVKTVNDLLKQTHQS